MAPFLQVRKIKKNKDKISKYGKNSLLTTATFTDQQFAAFLAISVDQ